MRTFDYTALAARSWSSKTLGLVAQIHEHKGRQELYLQQKPATLDRLVEIAKVQSTDASNRIEGIVTTDSRIRQLCMEKTAPRNRDEEEILGYRDVLNEIHENYEYIALDSSNILALHRDLYRYSSKEIGGRFKDTQNYITEMRGNGVQLVRFIPLSPEETPGAVDAACSSFNRAIDLCTIDPLILIPVFIQDFLCIHPFKDGNGRMSRLLTLLLLYRCGYQVGRYISPEKKMEQNKPLYYETLEQSGIGWYEGQNDPTSFIEFMLAIILSAYRDFEDRVAIAGEKLPAVETVRNAIAHKLGKFTKSELMELVPSLAQSTIENALKELVREGYITRHGNGKATFYTGNE